MDLLATLLETELFSGFGRADLEPLAPSLRKRTYARDSYLWHTGDPATSFVVVLSGLVKARHLEADGNEMIVQLVVPGETTGEFHLFDDEGRRYYDAIAVEPTDVVVVPREHVVFLLEHDARLTMKLAASMMRRLLRFNGGVVDIQLVDLEARLARRLLELVAMRSEPDERGIRIGVRLSQTLLGSTARATRENTNRVLARLVRSGVLEIRDGHVVVIDQVELVRRARL